MKKEHALLKAACSVIFAIIASAHHWLHTLLIALGLTTLGAGLLNLSSTYNMIFLLFSLLLSGWFLVVAKRKWNKNRPAAWVYLISSLIAIVIAATALPRTIADMTVNPQQQINE